MRRPQRPRISRTLQRIRPRLRGTRLLLAMWLLLAGCNMPIGDAQVVHITCASEPLIAAIAAANEASRPAVLVLPSNCTITLTSEENQTDGHNGLPSVRGQVAILGRGSTIRRAEAAGTAPFRIFHVAEDGELSLTDLTVSRGQAVRVRSPDWHAERGGGIYNAGTLSLNSTRIMSNAADYGAGIYNSGSLGVSAHSQVSNNVASATFGSGAGIYNLSGELNVVDSRISGNRGRDWGAGLYNSGGSATLTRTEVFENAGGFADSGVFNSGTLQVFDSSIHHNTGTGIFNLGALTVTGSTIAANPWGGIANGQGCPADIRGSLIAGNGGGREDSGVDGSGVFNRGAMTLSNSVVSGNFAGSGGGIFNAGELHITGSTVSANGAEIRGGGIENLNVADGTAAAYYDENPFVPGAQTTAPGAGDASGQTVHPCNLEPSSGALNISNTTISGNTAGESGGGLSNSSGGIVALQYVTVTSNSSRAGAGIHNAAEGGSLQVVASIVAGNSSGGDCRSEKGSWRAAWVNLDSDGTCDAFSMRGDPMLGPLQDNGGSTPTHALLLGSPAIDAARGECPGGDQRSAARPVGPSCDLGAYEYDRDWRANPGGEAAAVIPTAAAAVTPPTAASPPSEASGVSIIRDSLCWEGPGAGYEVVSSIQAGSLVRLLGVGVQKGWFVVENPRYHSPCWVPEANLNAPPDVAGLTVYAVPVLPTATIPPAAAAPPSGPGDMEAGTKVCDSSKYVVRLSWSDADGEEGYRIYRDGSLLGDVAANVTVYDDRPPDYNPHNYFVQAYNETGYSNGPIAQSEGCMY